MSDNQRTGWQPIETAPKDPNGEILIWWPSPVAPRRGWAFKVRWGYHEASQEYAWLIADTDEPDTADGTHWMPIPEGPI